VLDARKSVPAVLLAHAARLATEKAREAGVSLIRIKGLSETSELSGAPEVAEIASGPYFAFSLGPGRRWTIALPTFGDLPVLLDQTMMLSTSETGGAPDSLARGAVLSLIASESLLVPQDSMLMGALAVRALESPSTFAERVRTALASHAPVPGLLLPDHWEEQRRLAREAGVVITADAWAELLRWADKLGVTAP
jgi:LDH2 family malate/lactate/ureidoglycolate dehydrogenase